MKIDTSLIEGFESMTPEEKVTALSEYEFDDSELETLRSDKAKLKKRLDEVSSENSKLKKTGNQNLSEAERQLEDLRTEKSQLQELYDELKKKTFIAENKAKYLSLGYDDALAIDTANALAEGDMEKVFGNAKKHQEALEKKIKAEVMKGMGSPDGKGTPSKAMTKEEILKIRDAVERQKAIAEHLDLFQ